MATTFREYNAPATYSFTFPSYQSSDVKVRVDGDLKTEGTHYNITGYSTTGGGTVAFIDNSGSGGTNHTPSSGVVRIYRDTNVDTAKATFTAGSSVKAADLNNNTTQLLYRAQEEQIPNLIHSYDIDDDAITRSKLVADAVDGTKIANDSINSEHYVDGSIDTQHIADSQITSAKIADGTIVNADINASAAIAGTKVTPDFGSQNLSTSGTAATGALTVTGNIGVSGTVDGRNVANDGSKLDGIEVGATADQTASDIRSLVESATDSNVFTDADHAKLDGIDTGATDDQTASEIKTLIASSPLDSSHLAANSVGSSEIASNAVTTDKIADSELSTLAGMQSGTASKLAGSTALTADIADLNQIDGMQKATTVTDDDTKFPTSGAIVDYVAAQLEPFGGFEAIANESSFPNTQPVSGVCVSIADAGGMAVSSSGTASGATVGGTTVNISGIPTNFRGTTVNNGVRFIVVSTGSGQNYTYHKATLKEDDLVNLSGDINDFSERYRVGSSNPTTSLDNGDLFFNTGTGKMLVYNGTNTAWEEVQSVGNFFINTISSSSNTGGGSATANGTAYRFTLSNAGSVAEQHLVSVDGVVQKPNSGTSQPSEGFAVDGADIIFGSAPVSGASLFVITIGSTVNIGTPSNNTVTTAILQNGSVTTAKIVDANVTTAKLANDSVTSDKIPDNAVQNEHIADNSVGSDAIANGSVNTLELADDAVTAAKLASNSVTNAKVASNAISSATIIDANVTTAKIADDAVTEAKLANSINSAIAANTAKASITINNQDAANRLLTTMSTSNNINGEARLTWDDSAGLLTVKHGYAGGGGTGLLLFDNTSTGANEGMNIEWRSGTDKTSDQCRIGQFSNGTGDGSNLDFYTNSGDTGSSTRRLRIDQKGNLVTGNVGSPTSSDTGNIYVKPGSTIGAAGIGGLNIGANAVFNGSWKAIAGGATGIILIDNSGALTYRTDNYTNAGSNFSLETRLKILENGRTLIGHDTTVVGNENLTGALSRVQITGPATINSFTLANSYLHIGGTESYTQEGAVNGMLQAISFGHIKTTGTYAPAYVGLKTIDRAGHENGQIEIATRSVTTDTVPTPSLIVRPSKNIVRRGPSYGIWTEDVKTVNGGGTYTTQFIEDCYGQWVVVGKISSTNEFKGDMQSTRTLDTTNNQLTGDPKWSANWGDTYPSEVRYISASDWNYWRETRVLDWIHGVPDDRKWKNFFTSGQSSGMPVVGSSSDNKRGFTVAGCYDGFGRWRNPTFTDHKMMDSGQGGPTISETFFTTSGQTMNWYSGNTDAKLFARHDSSVGGQDDSLTTGYGWDDTVLIREDNFPNTAANGGGSDVGSYNLWICIKLDSPTFGHN